MFIRASTVLAAALLGSASFPLIAAPIALDPTLAGTWSPGTGARAEFRAIDPLWRDSAVLWNEREHHWSNGTPTAADRPVGEFTWGTGLWGLADWRRIQSDEVVAAARWNEVVSQIAQGNDAYRTLWASTWGDVQTLPAPIAQENWTVSYTGYLRINEAGAYNFGVLYDDGFFLRIHGADGQAVEIWSDFILSSRERMGFDDDLLLQQGLYRFELGAYNRLQAGVVQLAWHREGGAWELVPTEHLVAEPSRIPLPGTMAMIALGAIGIVATRKRPLR